MVGGDQLVVAAVGWAHMVAGAGQLPVAEHGDAVCWDHMAAGAGPPLAAEHDDAVG